MRSNNPATVFTTGRLGHGDQHGVALIVALVMLVVIGLTSAAVMRGALSSDLVTNNTRLQTLALQAAHVGLSYCERKASDDIPTIPILPSSGASAPASWEVYDNWRDESKVVRVTAEHMASENSTFVPTHLPECMVERTPIDGGSDKVYVVTSRGFSPDYAADDEGHTLSGSLVWLQSTILFGD